MIPDVTWYTWGAFTASIFIYIGTRIQQHVVVACSKQLERIDVSRVERIRDEIENDEELGQEVIRYVLDVIELEA